MSSDRFRNNCRLCLAEDAEFYLEEDKVSEKINLLLAVDANPNENFPDRICSACRIQLERLYIFRIKSQETDVYLRKMLATKDSSKEQIKTSTEFLKTHDPTFNEHDLDDQSTTKRRRLTEQRLTDEENESIEKAVQSTLQRSGYNGRFAITVEDIDEQGLRRVRVIKENGNNILMKLRMPTRADPLSVTPKKSKSSPGSNSSTQPNIQIEQIEELMKKCDRIEDMQDRVFRSVIKTEKVVFQIKQIQESKFTETGIEMADVPRDDDAPFVFPISHLSELWRLNTRLADPEVRELLTEEMSKIEASAGSKISGKIFRSLIAKCLISKICWSGRIKDGQKYVKSDDRVMLSKMKYLVEWMYSIVVAKEPETNMQTFLQTIMNIIRKERFKSKDSTVYLEDTEYLNEDYDEAQFIQTEDTDAEHKPSLVMITDI